jgi:uroporphyrinogen decarboxylase
MDIVEVKKKYGDKLTVMGGMDTGDPLCNWTIPEVVSEVQKRIRELAPSSGWMIASSNSVHMGVRPENYHAMVIATLVYGSYGSLGTSISPTLEATIGKIPITSMGK